MAGLRTPCSPLLLALLVPLLALARPAAANAEGLCANFNIASDNCVVDDNCLRVRCAIDLDVIGEISLTAALGLCGPEPVVKLDAEAVGLSISRTLTQDDIVPIPGFKFDIVAGVSAEAGIAIPTLVLNAGPGGNQLGFDMAVEACGQVPAVGRRCLTLFDLGTIVLPVTRPDVVCRGNSPFSAELSGGGGGDDDDDSGMSAGATAGIVIGVIVGIVLLVVVLFAVVSWRNGGRRRRTAAAAAPKRARPRKAPGTVDLAKLEERAFGKATPAGAAPVEPAADEAPVAAAAVAPKGPAPPPPAKAASGRKPPPRPAPRPRPRPGQPGGVASGWLATVAAKKDNESSA